jgi:hypothetical protein
MIRIFKIIILFLFIVQLVFSPALAYTYFSKENLDIPGFDFFMRVEPEKYFLLVIPSLLLFAFGFLRKLSFYNLKSGDFEKIFFKLKNSEKNYKIAKLLFLIFVSFFMLNRLGILFDSNFSARLLDSLVLVNCFYFIFSKGKYRIILFILLFSYFVFQTISSGMFGNLFFSSFIFLIYYGYSNKFGFRKAFIYSILIFFLFVSFQGLKSTYRAQIDTGGDETNSSASSFVNLFIDQIANFDLIFSKEAIFLLNIRVNQGLYLSHVMEHIPEFQNYTYGSNLIYGIAGSIVPRAIWPNKPKSGGVHNLTNYANLNHDGKTSINISPIGEAYVAGGFLFTPLIMFLYGLLLNYILSRIEVSSVKYNNFLLWIPIFILPLFQGVEEDISSILNYYIKFLFVFLMVFLIFKNIFTSK